MIYNQLKLALLKRYNFTEQGYRQRFREAKPELSESPGQFVVRLKNFLVKWMELSEIERSVDGLVDLIVREQFTNSCPKDLSVYLMERSPQSLEDMATLAEQYLIAHDRKFAGKEPMKRNDVKVQNRSGEKGNSTRDLRCYNCHRLGHRGV